VFLCWCEGKGITRLLDVQPVQVAAYIEQLGQEMSPPSVKQHLACIRMLFDWLVTGQVMSFKLKDRGLHDRRNGNLSVGKVERIGICPVAFEKANLVSE
jgi:site-specific recombinase XerD